MPQWPSADRPETSTPSTRQTGTAPTLPEDAGSVLLPLARAAIATRLGIPAPTTPDEPPWLAEPGACFVTLTTAGRLHGCIGTVWARRPLGADVRANAAAAAFEDRRFPPLSAVELEDTRVEVSVLSPTAPAPSATEAETLAALRPGVDGVVFECGGRRATLLPQVWASLPDPHQFLAHLRVKAGFPASFWSDQVRVSRYTVTEFHEPA